MSENSEKRAGVIEFVKCTDFDRVAKLLTDSGLDFKALIAETESLIVLATNLSKSPHERNEA